MPPGGMKQGQSLAAMESPPSAVREFQLAPVLMELDALTAAKAGASH